VQIEEFFVCCVANNKTLYNRIIESINIVERQPALLILFVSIRTNKERTERGKRKRVIDKINLLFHSSGNFFDIPDKCPDPTRGYDPSFSPVQHGITDHH